MQSDNLTTCGIQSYSLNCNQGHIFLRFSGLVNELELSKKRGPLHRDDFNRSCILLLRENRNHVHNEWRYFRHTWCSISAKGVSRQNTAWRNVTLQDVLRRY